ncbi:MAG TPA: hypothetical protein V6C72_18405 [Chroococcales cyanobacterium]
MPTPTDTTDRVSSTASRIESDSKDGKVDLNKLHRDINDLRTSDSTNGQVDEKKFKSDLSAVNKKLHDAGILPQLDLVENGNGSVGFRGVSEAGKSPSDGSASLVTRAHGTTFTYDKHNHVTSWSKNGDTWKYDSKDGEYHEFDHGKETGKSTNDVVTVGAHGRETVTHADGSTTVTSAWGGVIERNAGGQMTAESNGKSTKTFQYENGELSGMTVKEDGGHTTTYAKGADGKFYSSKDKDHKNPLDIALDTTREGVVDITDKNGNTTGQYWGGTDVHWDKDHHLTSIDYGNGNKATGFSYDANDQLTGFSMTGKDGKNHDYQLSNGAVSIDGGKPVAGTITADRNGGLKVEETGDGSDADYQSIQFNTGGSEVRSGKFGGKILPTDVIGNNGKHSTYKYDSNGDLTDVDAHGYNLHKSGNRWLDKNNKPADVVPITNPDGSFSVVHPDGTFESWSPGGVKTDSIPDTPAAITKEAKEAEQANNGDASGSPGSDLTNTSGDKGLAATIVRDATQVAESMHSHGLCLKGVATALEEAGVGNIHGGDAWMAGARLAHNDHFQEIPENSKLEPGDIVVHGPTSTNSHGHILVYLGNGEEASDHIAGLTSMDYGQWTRVFRPVG